MNQKHQLFQRVDSFKLAWFTGYDFFILCLFLKKNAFLHFVPFLRKHFFPEVAYCPHKLDPKPAYKMSTQAEWTDEEACWSKGSYYSRENWTETFFFSLLK